MSVVETWDRPLKKEGQYQSRKVKWPEQNAICVHLFTYADNVHYMHFTIARKE